MDSVRLRRRLSRRDFIRGCGGALACLAIPGIAALAAEKPRRRPNVIFILADDLGWMDTSLYGSRFYKTPNIDRLAKRGTMFTQAYAASPLCSPTRCSLMTGLWPARVGITSADGHIPEERLQASANTTALPCFKATNCVGASRLKQDYRTLAEALKEEGYATGHFGKWHLGAEPYDPLHQGFDVDVPHWSGPGPTSYLAPWKFPPKLNFTGKEGEHIEDRMSQEAVKFINANKDRPFYLNYWAFSVHSPWGAKPDLIERYKETVDPKNPQHNPLYAAMIQSLDEAVGKLVQTVDELGLTNDTIFVFFSDNGGVNFQNVDGTPVTSNAPLRAGKATLYEGGTREDCIIVWPGVTRGATKSDAVIQSVDFYPTILDMVGAAHRSDQKFDGVSLAPLLRKGTPPKRDAIFCYFPHNIWGLTVPGVYVRQGDWKLIRFFFQGEDGAHTYELYNLKADIGESNNLAAKMPDKVKQLDKLIDRFLTDSGAVLPLRNPKYDPSAKYPEEYAERLRTTLPYSP